MIVDIVDLENYYGVLLQYPYKIPEIERCEFMHQMLLFKSMFVKAKHELVFMFTSRTEKFMTSQLIQLAFSLRNQLMHVPLHVRRSAIPLFCSKARGQHIQVGIKYINTGNSFVIHCNANLPETLLGSFG